MDTLPIRRLNRLGNEAHLAAAVATGALGNGRFELGIVALVLLSRCVGDWISGETICRPKALSAHMPITAIARSLNAPYTTIYRYMAALIEQGIAIRTDAGFAIDNTADNSAKVIYYLENSHDQFLQLIDDIITVTGNSNTRSGLCRVRTKEIVQTSLDTWLMPFELAQQRFPELNFQLVIIAIAVANVRHITTNTTLSEKFAFEPVPDRCRLPIRTGRISSVTGLTYGTTFRICQKMAENGLIVNRGDGWIFGTSALLEKDINVGVRAMSSYYLRKITELSGLGYDLSNIKSSYMRSRPGYVML